MASFLLPSELPALQQKKQRRTSIVKRRPATKKRKPTRPPLVSVQHYIDSTAMANASPDHLTLVNEINEWLNVNYRRGGTTSKGVDCSGFVMMVYRKVFGLEFPHSAALQAIMGEQVHLPALEFGDLVFFQIASKRIDHVGIYLGESHFVHASGGHGVTVDALHSNYFKKRFRFARRLLALGAAPGLGD